MGWKRVNHHYVEPKFDVESGKLIHIQFSDEGYLCRFISLLASGVLLVVPYASTMQRVTDENEEIYLHDIVRYRLVDDVKELPLFVGWRYTTCHLAKALEGVLINDFREGSLEYIRRQLSVDGKVVGSLVGRVLSVMAEAVIVEPVVSDHHCGTRSGIPLRFILEHREVPVSELPVYISFPFKRPVYDRLLKGEVV